MRSCFYREREDETKLHTRECQFGIKFEVVDWLGLPATQMKSDYSNHVAGEEITAMVREDRGFNNFIVVLHFTQDSPDATVSTYPCITQRKSSTRPWHMNTTRRYPLSLTSFATRQAANSEVMVHASAQLANSLFCKAINIDQGLHTIRP
jgi:hypothetical protein